jgi:hypothetical protein
MPVPGVTQNWVRWSVLTIFFFEGGGTKPILQATVRIRCSFRLRSGTDDADRGD